MVDLKENRVETFFNLNQNSDNAITVILFSDGNFASYEKGANYFVFNNKKHELKEEIYVHFQLYEKLPMSYKKAYSLSESCRLWLPSNENKYPIFAIEENRGYSRSIMNLFKYYNIKNEDLLYFDIAYHPLDIEPEKTLIKAKNIFNINEICDYIMFDMLNEAKQVGELYHFTSEDNAKLILYQNTLKSGKRGYYNPYICFARSLDSESKTELYGGLNICFVVDGNKLSEHYKTKPFANPKAVRKRNGEYEKWDEMEERVYVQQIDDFNKYVNKVIINSYGKSLMFQKDIIDLAKEKNIHVQILKNWK